VLRNTYSDADARDAFLVTIHTWEPLTVVLGRIAIYFFTGFADDTKTPAEPERACRNA
jgi:hypothetical protein